MKFKEYDTVRIMKDCKEGVKRGAIGAILMAFEEPREAYEVEILDEKGNPTAQCTFLPDDLELVNLARVCRLLVGFCILLWSAQGWTR